MIYNDTGARGEGGFTLIELVVVIAVIAILMSLLVPPMIEYRAEAAERERAAARDVINDAIRQCYALEGRWPPAAGETGLDYLREHYGIVVRQDVYDYSYAVVEGSPVLIVDRLERDG